MTPRVKKLIANGLIVFVGGPVSFCIGFVVEAGIQKTVTRTVKASPSVYAVEAPRQSITTQNGERISVSGWTVSSHDSTWHNYHTTTTGDSVADVTNAIEITWGHLRSDNGSQVVIVNPPGATYHQVVDRYFDKDGNTIGTASITHVVDPNYCQPGYRPQQQELIASFSDDGKGNVTFDKAAMAAAATQVAEATR